jgi:hypothetical protein
VNQATERLLAVVGITIAYQAFPVDTAAADRANVLPDPDSVSSRKR